MEIYEAIYHTPLGFGLIRRFWAESMEEARLIAESSFRFGIAELVCVRKSGPEVVRYEGAKKRRDEPACGDGVHGSANRVSGR